MSNSKISKSERSNVDKASLGLSTIGSPCRLNEVLSISLKAHQVIGCKGVTRSDFKFENGKFYLLELNTQPGMTKLSLVPEIAAYKGISFLKLIEWMLNDASTKK